MSYYLNDGINVYSDVGGNKKIKEIWSSQIQNIPPYRNGFPNYGFAPPYFYIKDGSYPIFDVPQYDTVEGKKIIKSYTIRYRVMGATLVSSLSSKYYYSDSFGSYLLPGALTNYMFKTEIYKKDKPIISFVDRTKGGKLSWRISEENMKYFNYSDRGPSTSTLNNVFHDGLISNSIENGLTMMFLEKDNTSYMLYPQLGRFIKSPPSDTDYNQFGFTTGASVTSKYTPPHFTLKKSLLEGYTGVKIKIDGVILNANNSWNDQYMMTPAVDNGAYYNTTSFSANGADDCASPYCFAYFYKSDNSAYWEGKTELNPSVDYLDNEISSTLKVNSNHRLIVKNKEGFSYRDWKLNNAYEKEVQNLDDKNFWNHIIPTQISDWHISPDVTANTARCPNSADGVNPCREDCPTCTNGIGSQIAIDVGTTRYLKCCTSGGIIRELVDIKIPVYTAIGDTKPYGYWTPSDRSFSYARGCTCNGNGQAFKMSGTNDSRYWHNTASESDPNHTHPENWVYNAGNKIPNKFNNQTLVSCNVCGGQGKVKCECMTGTNKIGTTGVAGKIICQTCGGDGIYQPWASNDCLKRFKFYGKSINGNKKTFEGFIRTSMDSYINSYNLFDRYKELTWDDDDWESTAPNKCPSDYDGCYMRKSCTEADIIKYQNYITTGTPLEQQTTLTENVSGNWLFMMEPDLASRTYYYGYSNCYTVQPYGMNHTMDFCYNLNGTDKDGYNNPITINNNFKTTAMSPSSAPNFTLSNVVYEDTIKLSECTGDYLHISFPFQSMYAVGRTPQSIMPQLTVTYEGTK
jgi:hypothetical protein